MERVQRAAGIEISVVFPLCSCIDLAALRSCSALLSEAVPRSNGVHAAGKGAVSRAASQQKLGSQAALADDDVRSLKLLAHLLVLQRGASLEMCIHNEVLRPVETRFSKMPARASVRCSETGPGTCRHPTPDKKLFVAACHEDIDRWHESCSRSVRS